MRIKRLPRYVLSVVLVSACSIGILEIAAPLVLYIANGHWISRNEIQSTLAPRARSRKAGIALKDESPEGLEAHVLHPYLGFVRSHDLAQHIFNGVVVEEPVNELGFFGPPPVKGRADETVSVLVTGGSVALDLFLKARDVLRDKLRLIPGYGGREIRVISLALGGYKQPQQLLALNYLLSLDYDVDIVVNLDGFNEIVLPYAENLPVKVSPFYPRSWRLYTAKAFPGDALLLAGAIYQNGERTEKWRGIASRKPLYYSNLSMSLWYALRQRLMSQRYSLEKRLQAAISESQMITAQEQGPPYRFRSEQDIFADSARLWARSSEEMWLLCKANGIAYYHFLQPNQYVEGEKELTARELKTAFAGPDYPYRKGVEKGYSHLRDAGRSLVLKGVPFFDLTDMFREEERTIYNDTCCHVNQVGNELLAGRIASVIMDREASSR